MTERTPLLLPLPPPPPSPLIWSATATLGASLLGTGILSQPKACFQSGYVPFALFSLLALVLSHWTAIMLGRAGQGSAYADVVRGAFGPAGFKATAWAVVLQQIGACTAYVVVLGDVFHPLLGGVELWAIKSFLAAAVLFPLCAVVRELKSFRYTSAMSVGVIMLFAGIVVGNGFFVVLDEDAEGRRQELMRKGDETKGRFEFHGPNAWPKDFRMLKAIPLICFAYFMHFNTLPVLKTLQSLGPEKAMEAYTAASWRSFLLSGQVTVAFGILGYLTFLNGTESDVLTNFSTSGTYISGLLNVVRSFYGLGLILAFPVVFWEARENAILIFQPSLAGKDTVVLESSTHHRVSMLNESEDSSIADAETPPNLMATTSLEEHALVPFKTHLFWTVVLMAIITLLGCIARDLDVVFGLIGSTCCPILAYILPAAVYLKSGAAYRHNDETRAKIALVVGITLIPVGLVVWSLDQAGLWS